MEEKQYSEAEIKKALQELNIGGLEDMLFGKLDSSEKPIVIKYSSSETPSESFIKDEFKNHAYLKGQGGNKFRRLEDNPDNSFYKLISGEKHGLSKFAFHGNPREAIAKRIFEADQICDVLGSPIHSNYVELIEPGEIQYLEEEWKVIKPVKLFLKEK